MRGFALKMALSIVGLLLGAPCQAGTFTQVYSFAPGIDSSTEFVDQTLAAHRFDPAEGTLLSVDITFTISFKTSVSLTNSSGSTETGTVSTGVQFTSALSGTSEVHLIADPLASQSYTVGAGATQDYMLSSGTNSTVVAFTDLSAFQGVGGNFTLDMTTVTTNGLTGGATSSVPSTTDAIVKGFVTYTYMTGGPVIPEPSSLVLGAFGAIGILALSIRYRSVPAA
jgi:hypothetical protein